MQETSNADRKRELRSLLDKLAAHPEQSLTQERERVAVLQRMLGAQAKADQA